jgi:hypothetical protein
MQGNAWDSCCRLQLAGITHAETAKAPNCVECVLCKGCHACRENHICDATMFMGKWETKDGRKLYPFEMDSTHLVNAIKKLRRDKSHFKDNWLAWVKALEEEARLRKLSAVNDTRLIEGEDGRVHLLVRNPVVGCFEWLPGHADAETRRTKLGMPPWPVTCVVCIVAMDRRRAARLVR